MQLENLMKTAKRLASSRRGQVGAMKGVFLTLVTGGILALVGILVFSKVDSSIDFVGTTTAQNTSYTNVKTTILDAYDLAVVGFVVLAAVFILGIVFLLGGSA